MKQEPESASFFQNRSCAYFPCHADAAPETFNCMFCYCPLYPLGSRCGGNFVWLENGIKDCSHCLLPHQADACQRIEKRFPEILELAKQNRKDDLK